jgi:multiple sugar transport system permease protein
LTKNPLAFGSLSNFAHAWKTAFAFENGTLVVWLRNSAEYVAGGVALATIACVTAGYALSAFEFRGRKVLLWATVIAMLMPGTVLVLPIFLELNDVHLVDTAWAVIVPGGFFPFGVYLMFLYFRSVLSRDLLGVARMDGCSELQLFLRIAVPLSGPMVALVAFFTFVAQWNNYFLPLVVLPSSSKYPLAVGLQVIASADASFNPVNYTGAPIFDPELALVTVVVMVPVFIVLLLAQRVVMRGSAIMSGALVG